MTCITVIIIILWVAFTFSSNSFPVPFSFSWWGHEHLDNSDKHGGCWDNDYDPSKPVILMESSSFTLINLMDEIVCCLMTLPPQSTDPSLSSINFNSFIDDIPFCYFIVALIDIFYCNIWYPCILDLFSSTLLRWEMIFLLDFRYSWLWVNPCEACLPETVSKVDHICCLISFYSGHL